MDTDALIICDEENKIRENEIEESKTGKGPNMIVKLSDMLKNNPEIPDALRDLTPYFSPGMRPKIAQIAAFGDFMMRMSDTSSFTVSATEEPRDISGIYGTLKKYIPMNKRQNIDTVMGFVDNIKIKMNPKPAANGLENIINMLTRLNELNKIAASVGAAEKIATAISSPDKKDSMDTDGMVSLINSLMGGDKMKQIGSMLDKILGGNK